ncbi:MAG: hypothetical protein KJZ83_01955 [Burkholderiaceae bacterium]|nr:hypothetical protein [Burkholderiaceae bacterium]
MSDAKYLLFVRISSVPTEIESAWNQWYDTEHLPNRLDKPGFVAARRYRSIFGEYRYLTLYELSALDALTSAPYLELRAREASCSPQSFEVMTQKLPGFARGVYEQIGPKTGEYLIPDTSVLFVIGHDVPPNRDEEFNAWYDTEHLPSMLERVPGFVAGRRFRLVESGVPSASGIHTPGPKYVTAYDLADENVLETEAFKRETQTPWSAWVRSWYLRRFRILAKSTT